MKVVVSDTSPLFYLARIGRLSVLRELYGGVAVPESVWGEALASEVAFPAIGMVLREAHSQGWVSVHSVTGSCLDSRLAGLDAGEIDAIRLAREIGAGLLIIDEKLGREAAECMGLYVCGTLGVLVAAKRRGLITMIAPELQRLRSETSFRFARELEQFVLEQVGEQSP